MPLWTIQGADKSTGRDVVHSVDAPTELLAREEAEQAGILVSSIHRSAADPLEELSAVVQSRQVPASSPAPTLNYSTPRNPSTPALSGRSTPPDYTDIVTSARWLRWVSTCLGIIGLIFLAFGAVTLLLTLLGVATYQLMPLAAVGTPFAMIAIIWGILFLTAAALLRLAAATALAIRDIAINSFRK